MYEHVPVQRIADDVRHIYDLYRGAASSMTETVEETEARMVFLRGLINNLRSETSRPSSRALMELSRRVPLAIGGSFKLIGYRLEKMHEVDFLLNGHRTRIVDSYPFYRDREIDLPATLSERAAFERNAFISELVLRWQRQVPIRVLRGPDWQRDGTFHVQIGTEDGPALSGMPPGSVLSIEPISSSERANPDAEAMYCLQFGDGYRCSRCTVLGNKLVLLPYNGNYSGPYEFLHSREVRIAGRARGFAVSLPPKHLQWRKILSSHSPAPLILPWEQPSFHDLLRTERMRFGLTESDLDRANEIFDSLLGVTVSRRTLRRYERGSDGLPRADVLLALTAFHATRFRDVLRSLNFWKDEGDRFSLTTWLNARVLKDLPSALRTAVAPEPYDGWKMFLMEWGEWPALLSMTLPRMEQLQHRLLRIHRNETFNGLDPLIRHGAVALLEELEHFPISHGDSKKQSWDRPIYAIRHNSDVLCGYVESDGNRLTLIPHPRSSARRISFFHHQITVAGRFAAVASPL
jgi:transcriptional regulator with XRE-family HTH domain